MKSRKFIAGIVSGIMLFSSTSAFCACGDEYCSSGNCGTTVSAKSQKNEQLLSILNMLLNAGVQSGKLKIPFELPIQIPISEPEESIPQTQEPIVPQETNQETEISVSDYEAEVVRLVNEIRAENGLNTLSINQQLTNLARMKSQDMHDKHYFDHTSPTYGSPFDMMHSFGITYRAAAENIAKGQSTPKEVVDAWMNSAGHRKNILGASYTQIGVGYLANGNYWTQMFIG